MSADKIRANALFLCRGVLTLAIAVSLSACMGASSEDPGGPAGPEAPADPEGPEDPGPEDPGGGWEDPDDGSGLRAFPGAEGFGTDTPGGRGGQVYIVTTLDWDGPGSFREAMTATEPRIIVFRVSGTIHVTGSGLFLTEANSYVTVAGQTSPGGITFAGDPGQFIGNYETDFHDAIFRFLRFRGRGNRDCVSFNQAHHMVFDHCDFSGGNDESFDATEGHHFTVQWCTIANTESGKGALIAYHPTSSISIHHNLWAHNTTRFFPHMHWGEGGVPATGAVIEFSNNVGYNPGWDASMYLNNVPDASLLAFNLVGNYIKGGPSTPSSAYGYSITKRATVFDSDNLFPDYRVFDGYRDLIDVFERVPAPPITYHSPAEAFDEVLEKSGAFPRDPMNERVVGEALSGTGALGKFDDPLLSTSWAAPADADLDGMPDDWETARGLAPADPADAALDRDGDGYTNIEEYINGVAAFLIPD